MDKSNIDIQQNPQKSMLLRGNITVTPIYHKQTLSSDVIMKQLDASTVSLSPSEPWHNENSSPKRASIDVSHQSLPLEFFIDNSELIFFERNKLSEETTIVPVKAEASQQVRNVTNSSILTNMPTTLAVVTGASSSLKTKAGNTTKLMKYSTNRQQQRPIAMRGSSVIKSKTVHYKPIAPKSEDMTSRQPSSNNQQINPNLAARKLMPLATCSVSKQEKIPADIVMPTQKNEVLGKVKNVQVAPRNIYSYVQPKTKQLAVSPGMAMISLTEHNDKSKNLAAATWKPQSTLKMSVSNGPIATLKGIPVPPLVLKSTGNKTVIKRISGGSTSGVQKSLQQKPESIFKRLGPLHQLNIQKKSLSPHLNSQVDGKLVSHTPSNGFQQKASNKLIKVKGSQLAKPAAYTNTSGIISQPEKLPMPTDAGEGTMLKSSEKAVLTKESNDNGMPSRTVVKKKHGKRCQIINSGEMQTLDTELSFSQKQNVAHEILAELLVVTSQLPMVKFSHALETIELITDAYKLGHRVNMSILRQEESNVNDIDAFDVCYESDVDKTSPNKLTATQVDGQLDIDRVKKFFKNEQGTDMVIDDEDADKQIKALITETTLPTCSESLLEDEHMKKVHSRKTTISDYFSPHFPDNKKLKTDLI